VFFHQYSLTHLNKERDKHGVKVVVEGNSAETSLKPPII